MEGRPLDDAGLVERAKDGDQDAYNQLVQRHQAIAFRTAYLIAGNSSDAEDAAQEAFVKAYYALGRFRSQAAFRPWLLAIVANEARNRRRSTARAARLALRAESVRPSGDAAPSPEAAALSTIDQDSLLAALDGLPEADRLVIACRYLLDLSEKETAAALDCPKGTVKSRLSRALKRLRSALEAPDA